MNSNKKIYIATRGSALALAQANMVLARCRAAVPQLTFELKIIKTTGDKLQTASLAQEGTNLPKGLFTKELEVALLEEVPVAVEERERRVEELPQLLFDCARLGQKRYSVAIELGHRIVEQHPEDLVLGVEVQIDGALGEVGAASDLMNGRARQPVTGERVAGCVEDLPSAEVRDHGGLAGWHDVMTLKFSEMTERSVRISV